MDQGAQAAQLAPPWPAGVGDVSEDDAAAVFPAAHDGVVNVEGAEEVIEVEVVEGLVAPGDDVVDAEEPPGRIVSARKRRKANGGKREAAVARGSSDETRWTEWFTRYSNVFDFVDTQSFVDGKSMLDYFIETGKVTCIWCSQSYTVWQYMANLERHAATDKHQQNKDKYFAAARRRAEIVAANAPGAGASLLSVFISPRMKRSCVRLWLHLQWRTGCRLIKFTRFLVAIVRLQRPTRVFGLDRCTCLLRVVCQLYSIQLLI